MVLRFIVNDSTIQRDPDCDFSGIRRGDPHTAEFLFSKEWDNYVKVASFSRGDIELEPQILKNGTRCTIPASVDEGTFFRLHIIGKNGSARKQTNPILLIMKGGT